MDTSGLLLAYSAGLVAAVNPCGFALLPAYLSLLVLGDDSPTRARALGRAIATSGVMTLAFVAVFLTFGLVISPVASSAQQYLPWVTLVLGVGLALAGAWLLSGRRIPGVSVNISGPRVRRGFVPVLLYGVGYAAASLTCTVAPFLAVVVSSFRTDSVGSGVLLFAAYGVGMGTVVTTAAVAVALARVSLVARLRRAGRGLTRAAGVLLLLVGGYVAYYGWWELRVLDGANPDDPLVMFAADIQSAISSWVGRIGLFWLLPIAFVALALAVRRPLRRAGR